jgi:hypothetical protein
MLMSVRIDRGASGVRIGQAQPMFQLRPRPSARLDAYPYDVARDGRVLVNGFVEDITTSPVRLVINWPAGLSR